MTVMGFSAGAIGHEGNVDRMVKAVLEQSGHETEFVKLAEHSFTACKGCARLCAKPQVCKLEDEMYPYYHRIKEADAVVLGSPVRFSTVSRLMLSFIDRFWGYRHVDFAIKDKPVVLVVCSLRPDAMDGAVEDFRRALRTFRVNVLDVVTYVSYSPPCFTCGRHHECRIGGLYRLRGEAGMSLEITPELYCRWEDQPQTVERVAAAADKLKGL